MPTDGRYSTMSLDGGTVITEQDYSRYPRAHPHQGLRETSIRSYNINSTGFKLSLFLSNADHSSP